jgi:hypothetical protein
VGRWTAVDPKRQFFSSYVGMGNNPIISIDPDGAYSKWGASIRAFFTKGSSDIYRVGNQWGFNAPDGTNFEVNGSMVNGYSSYFGDGSGLDLDLTVGLQAGFNIKWVGSIDVNVVNFELWSSNPEKYYDNFTTVTNSLGVNIQPGTYKLIGGEIGQRQDVMRVPGGNKIRNYHTYAKGSILGNEKEWADPEPEEQYVTRTIFGVKALLGIDIVWKERIK